MNGDSKSKVIECIAKENYDNFCDAVRKTKSLWKSRQIVIFGAGILGLQFANVLRSQMINDFIFCDNDGNKCGKAINEVQVFPTESIIKNSGKYFVFLAIEDYFECAKQLEKSGLQQGLDWYNLKNHSEMKIVEDFKKDLNAQILVMGDCTATNVSIEDKMKSSLKDLLYRKDEVKVLAMNGTYMRAFYNIFLMCLNQMNLLRKAVILLGLDIFESKYHLLSKNQHEEVFKEMYEFSNIQNIEVEDFMQAIKERGKNVKIFNFVSPNRTENLSDSKIEQERRIHLKLNYLYDLVQDTESVKYLDKMLSECLKRDIKLYFVLMPVNWEMGEKYFGNRFYKKYNQIKDVIYDHIIERKGRILDLSYFLTEDDFICLRSTNEGIKEDGRKKTARIIMNELGVIK